MTQEKRVGQRKSLRFPVTVFSVRSPEGKKRAFEKFRFLGVNIGPEGLALKTTMPLETEDLIELEVELPGVSPLKLSVVVLRVTTLASPDTFVAGIKIINPTAAQKLALEKATSKKL